MSTPGLDNSNPIALAITGASGAPYALRLLEVLLALGERVDLMISAPGQIVISMETELKLPGQAAGIQRELSERFGAGPGQLRVFGREEWTAPVASGSSPPRAMVVCPCTTGTLAGIAAGTSSNLIERAADVAIKEGRR
ncbi:MAG: flavoprotein, partial [Thiogranum sp.]